jgi:hypothetical protein
MGDPEPIIEDMDATAQFALSETHMASAHDVHRLHLDLIRLQRHRVNVAVTVERKRGTGIDAHASQEIKRLSSLVNAFYRIPKGQQQPTPESSGFLQRTLLDVLELPRTRKIERREARSQGNAN